MKFRNAAETAAPWLRVFLFGPSRSGKTEIASTFPDPTFIIPYNEDSIETLRGRNYPYGVLGEEDPARVMNESEQALTKMKAAAMKGADNFHQTYGQTIVFESVSHYQSLVIAQLEGFYKDNRQVYGAWYNHLMTVRDILWALPAHIIVTALDSIKTDDQNRVTDYGPMISGRGAKLFPSSCHIVGVTEQLGGPKFYCHLTTKNGYSAGSRLAGLPNKSYENFTYPDHIAPALAGPNG